MNPAFILVRLYRGLPLFIALGVIAVAIFLIVAYRYSRPKAKQVLLIVFTWINAILTGIFGLATLYALFEENENVVELMGVFFITRGICLIITLLSFRSFYKKYPTYKKKPTSKATNENLYTRLRDFFERGERVDAKVVDEDVVDAKVADKDDGVQEAEYEEIHDGE